MDEMFCGVASPSRGSLPSGAGRVPPPPYPQRPRRADERSHIVVAVGESREPLVLRGRPVRFGDLVAAVRPLAAKAYAARLAPPPSAEVHGEEALRADPLAIFPPFTRIAAFTGSAMATGGRARSGN
jgi:hypothetical protein